MGFISRSADRCCLAVLLYAAASAAALTVPTHSGQLGFDGGLRVAAPPAFGYSGMNKL
jgi:hypothetical protein